MRTKLKDIADKLNLSTALVSGVLNNRPNVWASDATRARIEEAARQLNYQPSAAAQALSRGRTDSVAFVYRRLEGFDYRLAYSGLVDALSEVLQECGYDLVVANFATQEAVLAHLQKLAGSRSCDAVILWGREQDTEPQGELLQKLKVPFLVKGRHENTHPNWSQVDFDHEGMIEKAVDHLVGLGHRRLAYLGFPHNDGFVHALRRGFVWGHRRHFDAEPNPAFIAEHQDEVSLNEQTIRQWLSLPYDRRPTGFVIGSGHGAWQALETSLVQIGERLELRGGRYAAVGIAPPYFRLMFGEADVFRDVEIDKLARLAGPNLLNAILRGEEHSPIHRLLPELTPASTLELTKHGVVLGPSQREVSQ